MQWLLYLVSDSTLNKNYEVHGLVRRVALEDENHRLWRLRHVLNKITLHPASLESYASIINIITKIKPHEIYHLGAQSYIDYAFKDIGILGNMHAYTIGLSF